MQNNLFNVVSRHANELKVMIYSVFVYLNIDTDVVQVLMWLMLFDTIFGVWKSLVLGEVFKFKLLLFGVVSKLFVLLIPMALALVGKGLGYVLTPIVDIVLRVLVVAEGISIFSSFYMIRTKKRIENIDVITLLLSAVRNKLLQLANYFIGKIDTTPVEIPMPEKEENSNNLNE